MSEELETAALASAGGLAGRAGPRGEAQACANCGEPIEGAYCPGCGQRQVDMRRPIWTLAGQATSDLFSVDGRLWRTVPPLMLRPGRVTRAYLDGQRARHVPPFRLFLLSSLLFFVLLFAFVDEPIAFPGGGEEVRGELGAGRVGIIVDEPGRGEGERWLREDGTVDRDVVKRQLAESGEAGGSDAERLVDELADAYDNQTLFTLIVQNWAPRLALFLIPVMIFSLAVLHVFHRKILIYDHMIVALHFQTFMYLLGAALLLAGAALGGWVWWLMLVAPPIYLHRMLRRAYGTGRLFTLIRTLFILATSTVVIALLALTLVAIGVMQV